MIKRNIVLILILFFIFLVSAQAKKENELRVGAYLGMYMPTNSFGHNFNPSLTYGLNCSYEWDKKERIDLTLGMIDWSPGDNEDVQNLNFSMSYIHLGFSWFFDRSQTGLYLTPRFGLLFRNYSYKDEFVDSKSDNMIYSVGGKVGYLYEINDKLLLNGMVNLDLALRNSEQNAAFTDDGEIMIYYGFAIGIIYNIDL
ncbi:hypothetical protein ACFLSQ_12005 [Bacteroidota bacterium]